MKKMYLAVAMVLFIANGHGQKSVRINVGPATYIPVNNLSENLNPGVGFNVKVLHFLNSRIILGASGEYLKFNGKNETTISGNKIFENNNADLSLLKI
jgi:hypothetical protein